MFDKIVQVPIPLFMCNLKIEILEHKTYRRFFKLNLLFSLITKKNYSLITINNYMCAKQFYLLIPHQ